MYKTLTYNGRTLGYEDSGTGPAVVLLHGFAEDQTVWAFEKVLAQQFRLILPDFPGSGASEPQADIRMEGLADAVRVILDAENISVCTLIGHSMGGYVALAFAEKYNHRLQGLGLFHSSAFADSDEKIATRKKGIQFIREHGAANFLKSTSPNLYSPATKETNPALIEQQLEQVQHFSSDILVAYYEAMMARRDRTEVLRLATVPVLFAFGRHDTAVPLEQGLAQSHVPQTAYIHILEQSGHMGMVEEPERSVALLNQYLSQTAGLL